MALSDSLSFLRVGRGLRLVPAGVEPLAERLSPCLPVGLRRLLAGRDRRLLVCPSGESAELFLVAGEERQALGLLGLSGSDPLPAPAIEGAKDQGRRTVLILPADAVLRRRVSLPAQVRETLPQAIRFELDRLSPFTAEQALYDFVPLPQAKGETRLRVELALCRRDRVDAWLRRLREAGSATDQVTWEGAWPKANLLPAQERPRRRQPLLDPVKLLLVLVLVLAAAAMATPLWQKTQALKALESEVRKMRTQAVAVDEARQELERARRGSTEVLRQKMEQPRMLDLLREMTERIPEDTWVQSLEYQNGEVQVRGESGQATALIGLLEDAPGIDGVSFRSPVTQVARTGKERFNLAFNYKPASPADGGGGAGTVAAPGASAAAPPKPPAPPKSAAPPKPAVPPKPGTVPRPVPPPKPGAVPVPPPMPVPEEPPS